MLALEVFEMADKTATRFAKCLDIQFFSGII